MPLKDLFAKAPSPLPPSEEPWPRSEASSSCLREKLEQSPLHSATARPTLDEFLRTNYLMIPGFLLQVNKAKIAARTGKSVEDVQNTASPHSMVNQGGVRGPTNPPSFNIVNRNDKEVEKVETSVIKEKVPSIMPEIRSTKSSDKLFSVLSRKPSYEEIQVPPPLKPKPRVKKVMKGGTLVTIPAPQPRNRAMLGSADDAGKSIEPGIDLISREGRENAVAVSEMSVKGSVHVEELGISSDCHQLATKDDSTIPCHELESDPIIQSEVSSKNSKGLVSGIAPEECEQRQAPLTFCSIDIMQKDKNTAGGNSNDSFIEPESNASTKAVSKEDKIIVLQRTDPEMSKDSGSAPNRDVQGEFIKGSKIDPPGKAPNKKGSELRNKELKFNDNLGEVLRKDHVGAPPSADPEEIKISMEPVGKTEKGLGSNDSVIVDPQLEASSSSEMEKLPDMSHDLAIKSCNIMKQSSVKGNNGSQFGRLRCHYCYDDDDKNSDSGSSSSIDDDDDDDDDNGGDHDDDDGNNDDEEEGEEVEEEEEGHASDDDSEDVSTKDNPVNDSGEEYAELVMDDSTSEEEEEEYDFCPVNQDDSDEEEEEEKSDYEAEDMNLDSDTETPTGGITVYQDTTIGQRVKQSRNKQREKRKAKNKRKKASKKRAKAAKQAAKGKNTSHDSTSRKKTNTKQSLTPASQKKEAKVHVQPKNRGPVSQQKSAEASSKPKPEAKKPLRNNPPQESASEEGSLLSLVSSCAVDLTVAASEKFFLKKRRGGQHNKKMKKAKRKAEALDRIRRGEPPPRTRRVFEPLPQPICTFYREGKCRKGSDCSFRHDRSALIKKKEVCSSFPCKFFHTSRCREADICRFSHDPLTEETKLLLQACLKPPIEDPVQSPQEKNFATSNQQTADGTRGEGTLQPATSSSPYNLRASARKRTLSTEGTVSGSMIGGKISRQEIPENEDENSARNTSEVQPCAFMPGLYRDLST
ncbi:hypothetical protein ACROYT_G016378 [Oculina patagonica]